MAIRWLSGRIASGTTVPSQCLLLYSAARPPDRLYSSPMRAIIVQALGDPDVLTIGTTDIPRPKAGQVLVRLQAVGVNFSDT